MTQKIDITCSNVCSYSCMSFNKKKTKLPNLFDSLSGFYTSALPTSLSSSSTYPMAVPFVVS